MRTRLARMVTLLGMLLLASAVLGGCAGMAKRTVRGGLGELERAHDAGRLKKFNSDIYDAAYAAVQGALEGGIETLDERDQRKRLKRLSEGFGKEITSIAGEVGQNIGAEMRNEVVGMVEDILKRTSKARRSLDIPKAAQEITRRTIRTAFNSMEYGIREQVGPALGSVVRDEIGPAFADTLRQDIGPAIAKLVREDLKPELAATVRDASGSAVLGIDDAVQEILARNESEGTGLIGAFDRSLRKSKDTAKDWLLVFLAAVVTALAVLLVLWSRARFAARSSQQRAELRENTLLLLAKAIRSAHNTDRDGLGAYRRALKALVAEGEHAEAYGELSRLLASQPELQLPPKS